MNLARDWLKPAHLTVTQADGSEMKLEGMIVIPVKLGKQNTTLQQIYISPELARG